MHMRAYELAIAVLASTTFLVACSGQPVVPTVAPATSTIPAPTAIPATEAAPTVAATLVPTAIVIPTVASTIAPTETPVVQSANGAPRFTHPLEINNPFYPVGLTGRTIALGQDNGQSARNEVTLLPDTKMITLDDGQQVETRVTQFVAFTGGKLVEVAYDYFAQADDGSVYYLGEEVSNYADGKIINHNGSWLAGQGGAPAALIMPAKPEVGQKFNPENLPGVVYESDEILSLTQQVVTPAGPTNQGLRIKEILMDGSIEHKIYAANYGIIEEQADGEQLNLVLFNRADAPPGVVPQPLVTIETQAEDIIDVMPSGNWVQITADIAAIVQAAQTYQSQAASNGVPQAFQAALTAAVDRLQKASAAKQMQPTMQAANDVSAAVVDLYTVYHPTVPADLGQLDVLERQIVLDVASKDFDAAQDSLAKIDAVWARLKPLILAHNGDDTQFEASLAAQQKALSAKNSADLTSEASHALALVDTLEGLF